MSAKEINSIKVRIRIFEAALKDELTSDGDILWIEAWLEGLKERLQAN